MENKTQVLILLENCLNATPFLAVQFNQSFNKYKGKHFVYVLENNGEPIYIGHTKNVYTRLVDHKMTYNFTNFWLFEYDKKIILEKERAWIKLFQPTFNIRSKK
jgi:hypothetical protein